MKLITLISCFLVHNFGSAQSLWVTSPSVAKHQLVAHVLALGPNHSTFADHLAKKQQNPASDSLVNEALQTLQTQFLTAPRESLNALFINFIEDMKALPLSEVSRQAIHYAYLRLAQLSPETTTQGHLLRTAADWAPDLTVDAEVFPPPFIAQYEKMKATGKGEKKFLNLQLPWANYFVVNGRLISSEDAVAFNASSTVSLEIFSNHYWPLKLQGQVVELVKQAHLLRQPIVTGQCEQWNLNLSRNLNWGDLLIFEDPSCDKKILATKLETKNLKPSLHFADSQLSLKAPERQPLWQSKWFWAGLSVVAVGWLIHENQKSEPHREPQPTTTYSR